MRQLDPDSHEMLEILKGWRALPTRETDPIEYQTVSRSAQLPPSPVEIDSVEDIRVPGPDGDLTLRLYRHGRAEGPAPLLLFLHGGGFVVGGLETHDDMCRRLVQATGWMLTSVEYRLAPQTRFPGPVEDGYAALVWAAGAEGRARGIDPARIVVIGDSAGGSLAASVALMAKRRGGPALAGQILLYPCLDPRCAGESYTLNATGYFLTSEACGWYWQHYMAPGADPDDPLLCPLRSDDLAGLPPTTVITAGFDPLRDDGRAYADQLRAAGVETDYLCLEGTFHGFLSFGHLQAAARACDRIVERLAAL